VAFRGELGQILNRTSHEMYVSRPDSLPLHVTLHTLERAAAILGKRVRLDLVEAPVDNAVKMEALGFCPITSGRCLVLAHWFHRVHEAGADLVESRRLGAYGPVNDADLQARR
jgi:hypothetical protein